MRGARTLLALRDGVERQEAELRVALAELTTVARTSADPAHWIREKPLLCVVGAFAFGLWLGGRARAAQ